MRTPQLRALAKQMTAGEAFLRELPHTYFEEDQIHAFLLAAGKDFEETAARVDRFLPYVNNWTTCDQMTPKVFKKNHSALLSYIEKWISSSDTYAVRFGIKMLMYPFLETFQLEKWTHNKAIQKGIESFRITSEQKEQLKKLRIK